MKTMGRFAYAVRLTADEKGLSVSCRDLPELRAHGMNSEQALLAAQQALDELFAARMARNELMPTPTERRVEECTVCASLHLIHLAAQRTAPFPP